MAWGTGAPPVSSNVPRSKRTLVMLGGARQAKRMPDGRGAETCEIAGLVSRDPMAAPGRAWPWAACGQGPTSHASSRIPAKAGARAMLNEG